MSRCIFVTDCSTTKEGSETAAASLQDLAGAQVLRNLSTPIKLLWERNESLNPKRAFTDLQLSLKQSVVGMRNFCKITVGGIVPDEPVLQSTDLD